MKRAVLFTGLVRNAPLFLRFINAYALLPEREGCPLYYSTWIGELDRHPEVRRALINVGAVIVEQPEPDLVLPGHTLHQMLSLDLGLSVIGQDVFVYKSRPDFADIDSFKKFLGLVPRAPRQGSLAFPGQKHRFCVLAYFASQPMYINDIVFAGNSSDLRNLSAWPFSATFKYLRTAPEQIIWGGSFIPRNVILDAYFRSNVGLVFGNAELFEASREVLLGSTLYAYSLAVYFELLSASFDPLDAGYPAIPECPSAITLEQLLWDRLPGFHWIDHHLEARVNSVHSTGVAEVVLNGTLADSPLGRAVFDALMQIRSGPEPFFSGYGRGLTEAHELGRNAAQVGLHGFKIPRPYQEALRLEGARAEWRPLGERTARVAELEAEVNQMRRTIESLMSRVKEPKS
jgi:hypothetical protein